MRRKRSRRKNKENSVKKQLTYEDLLNENFKSFGYFVNELDKTLEEVREYFGIRVNPDGTRTIINNRDDIQIRGEYVRKNVDSFYKKILEYKKGRKD